jgi:hypothetical protein
MFSELCTNWARNLFQSLGITPYVKGFPMSQNMFTVSDIINLCSTASKVRGQRERHKLQAMKIF